MKRALLFLMFDYVTAALLLYVTIGARAKYVGDMKIYPCSHGGR